MLKKSIEDICNRQVDREGYSSNLYIAMASWAEVNGYSGVAAWLYSQSDEERIHMLKFIKYIVEEEASARIILDKMRLVGKNNMYEFDRDILSLRRTATNAPAVP